MEVSVNGQTRTLEKDCTVEEMLTLLGYADKPVAVAVNLAFVPKSKHPGERLRHGDAIDIVAPMQGG